MKAHRMAATAVLGFALSACSTSEKQVTEVIKKNPKIVFDVIEENPQQFIEVVNRAARKAQEGQQQKQLAEAKKQEEEQIKNPMKPELKSTRQLSGAKDGKITIVEYADFQCPACGMAFEALQLIKAKYKDQVRFFFKNMPLDFHKMAAPSSLYFEGIFRQDRAKALKFYEFVFENQNQLRDEDFLKETAKKVGADMKKLETAMASDEVKNLLAADRAEFEKFGFTGTPVIMVNGVAMNGAQPAEEIERMIRLTTAK